MGGFFGWVYEPEHDADGGGAGVEGVRVEAPEGAARFDHGVDDRGQPPRAGTVAVSCSPHDRKPFNSRNKGVKRGG